MNGPYNLRNMIKTLHMYKILQDITIGREGTSFFHIYFCLYQMYAQVKSCVNRK